MEKSIGEMRVRADFNVSGSGHVDEIKNVTAHLINSVESLKVYHAAPAGNMARVGESVPMKQVLSNDPEQLRLIALAQTAYEEACMWAVKAITFKK